MRRGRARTGALALVLLLACDQRPVVNVSLSQARVDDPPLSTFARVTLAVDSCDTPATAPLTLYPLDVSPGSRPELELDVLPDTALSVWVAAWRACPAAECVSSARPSSGPCLCDQGQGGAPLVVAYEGCSGYERFPAGGAPRTVNISLTATQAVSLCPVTPRCT